MHATQTHPRSSPEELLAELTDAAYQVVLRHGFRGPFLNVELDLWTALRHVFARRAAAESHAYSVETEDDLEREPLVPELALCPA